MPSSTFFNLPPEKRERFLAAARAEFARVPYAEASVNQIIRRAGIPRGSFYMYFADKEELFYYVIGTYGQALEEWMDRLLEERSGDLFSAFLGLFDYIQERCREEEHRELLEIIRLNRQIRPGCFFQRQRPDGLAAQLRERVDLSRLDLRDEDDLEQIVYLLISATGAAVAAVSLNGDVETARTRLVQMFGILKRGAAREPVLQQSKE